MTERGLGLCHGIEIPPIRLRSGQAIARDDRASPLSAQPRIHDQHDQGQTGATGQFRTGVHSPLLPDSCPLPRPGCAPLHAPDLYGDVVVGAGVGEDLLFPVGLASAVEDDDVRFGGIAALCVGGRLLQGLLFERIVGVAFG